MPFGARTPISNFAFPAGRPEMVVVSIARSLHLMCLICAVAAVSCEVDTLSSEACMLIKKECSVSCDACTASCEVCALVTEACTASCEACALATEACVLIRSSRSLSLTNRWGELMRMLPSLSFSMDGPEPRASVTTGMTTRRAQAARTMRRCAARRMSLVLVAASETLWKRGKMERVSSVEFW